MTFLNRSRHFGIGKSWIWSCNVGQHAIGAHASAPVQEGSVISGMSFGACMLDSSQAWGPDSGQIHNSPCATCVGNALAFALSLVHTGSAANLPDCTQPKRIIHFRVGLQICRCCSLSKRQVLCNNICQSLNTHFAHMACYLLTQGWVVARLYPS